ncbi:lysine-specific histone demethylase 1 [Cladophialophora psammophila CBS 110553]|uniref:Lysine-specific histone demethylase 1 n=1 Tax=Cladophialophora psammophila CBS 110553 TaxID=1182543 RepID=W9X1X3_9EURO|nr:lysine-specific histone demethylase 1 [Cladophialophora psammophila CBS 110553]EXJ74198.1 lysine-specific histone demethylase 1 [Cladophialophora psammophila CBS 110553]
MAPNIDKEAEHLRNKARKELLGLLEGVRGKKNLVIGRDLTGLLSLFVQFPTLKEYGVDKVFELENGNTDSSQRNVVYLVHGEKASLVQSVAEQIKKLQRNGSVEHEISVCWVPRRTLVSNRILEDEGILGDVNVSELPIYFLPLEDDMLSMEMDEAFNDLYLRHDPSPLYLASKALMQIQQRHGLFPRILGKGDNARQLANLLLRGRRELDADDAATQYTSMPSTSIEQLIIIDRDVDFATVLLTQLTYEGLIDELVGIKHNRAEVDSAVIGAAPLQRSQTGSSSTSPPPAIRQGLKRRIQLDSSDSLYEQLRSSNFALIGPHLNKIARRLESDYEGRHTARGINELRDFVNKLPGFQQEHQSLAIHTNLADDLSKHTRSETFNRELEVQQNIAAGTDPIYQHDTIEELIARDTPLSTILRLLCLESTIAGGLRPKDLESFRRQILHAYGFQHLLTLDKLQTMGLLQPRSSSSALLLPVGGAGAPSEKGTKTNYGYLRKELKLIIDEYNEQDPEDIAYVYSGYAPLSIRIVQCILQKQYLQTLHKSPLPLTPSSTGWAGFEDILKSARGPTFNIAQKPADEKAARAKAALAGTGNWKTLFFMFVGGITFTEIAALRFIGRKLAESGQRKKIVICTTGIISGRSIMEGVIEKSNLGSRLVAA